MAKTFRKILLATLTSLSVSAPACGLAEQTNKVYLLLPATTLMLFKNLDATLFAEAIKKTMPFIQAIVQDAQGNQTYRHLLVEESINRSAKVTVPTVADSSLATGILEAAYTASVPVDPYNYKDIEGSAAPHVLYDPLTMGKIQGKRAAEFIRSMKTSVNIARIKGSQGELETTQYETGQNEYLDPLITIGKAKVVCDRYIPNWNPVAAQAFAEECLTRTHGEVDLFLGMNDATASGAVRALISQGYNPDAVAIIGGQDTLVHRGGRAD